MCDVILVVFLRVPTTTVFPVVCDRNQTSSSYASQLGFLRKFVRVCVSQKRFGEISQSQGCRRGAFDAWEKEETFRSHAPPKRNETNNKKFPNRGFFQDILLFCGECDTGKKKEGVYISIMLNVGMDRSVSFLTTPRRAFQSPPPPPWHLEMMMMSAHHHHQHQHRASRVVTQRNPCGRRKVRNSNRCCALRRFVYDKYFLPMMEERDGVGGGGGG